MSDVGNFSEKLERRLFKHAKEKAERLLQVDSQMKQFLEKRQKFNDVALRIKTSVVYPRMQELARTFENYKLKAEGLHSICEFSPTESFPASATLNITFSSSGNYKYLNACYNLDITPALMEYVHFDVRNFKLESPSCEEEIGEWVEQKLLDFIDAYLQIETHPEYQKENYVTDPVCQMRFPIAQAASRIEQKDCTIYFCSEVCKEAFQKESRELVPKKRSGL